MQEMVFLFENYQLETAVQSDLYQTFSNGRKNIYQIMKRIETKIPRGNWKTIPSLRIDEITFEWFSLQGAKNIPIVE
jgi:hypothetical protein